MMLPMHRITIIALSLSLLTAACADEPPAWLVACESATPAQLADACKESCAAAELCAGASQPACEIECRACAPDAAWCPVDVAVPQ